MTKTELFKKAHTKARQIVGQVGNYMVAFKLALKWAWEEVKMSTNEISTEIKKAALRAYHHMMKEAKRTGGDVLLNRHTKALALRSSGEMPEAVRVYFDQLVMFQGSMDDDWAETLVSTRDMAATLGIDLADPENKYLKRELHL